MEHLKFLHLKAVKCIRLVMKLDTETPKLSKEADMLRTSEFSIERDDQIRNIEENILLNIKLRGRIDKMYHNTESRINKYYLNKYGEQ